MSTAAPLRTRRTFCAGLALLGLTTATAAGWLCGSVRAARAAEAALAARRLRALLLRPDRARLLGKVYLWQMKPRPDLQALTLAVLPHVSHDPHTLDQKRELRNSVRAQVEADFASVRVVDVGGWLLAETEARLCGIVALAEDD